MKKFNISLVVVGLFVAQAHAAPGIPLDRLNADAVLLAAAEEVAVEAVTNLEDGAAKQFELPAGSPLTKEESVRLLTAFCVATGKNLCDGTDRVAPELRDLRAGGRGAARSLLVLFAHKAYAQVAKLSGAPRDTVLKDNAPFLQKLLLNLLVSQVAGAVVDRFDPPQQPRRQPGQGE